MTRDDIIRMARECGFGGQARITNLSRLRMFANLVAAAEREACANLCEEHWRNNGNAMECADAIRARGKK